MLNRNSALGSYCVDQDAQDDQKFEEEKECASPPQIASESKTKVLIFSPNTGIEQISP